MAKKGLVYLFTGDGKGKTSAALGVAIRAVGHNKRVAMVQWYKQSSSLWVIGEHQLPKKIGQGIFEIYPLGQGFYSRNYYNQNDRFHYNSDQHQKTAQKALEKAKELLSIKSTTLKVHPERSRRAQSSELKVYPERSRRAQSLPRAESRDPALFLLILDEVLNAVNDNLISLKSLISLISQRQKTHLILTGRNAPQPLIDLADLVTEMKKLKHPFDHGLKAVPGLDY